MIILIEFSRGSCFINLAIAVCTRSGDSEAKDVHCNCSMHGIATCTIELHTSRVVIPIIWRKWKYNHDMDVDVAAND